jgi:Tfp pilus assembly protein PilN
MKRTSVKQVNFLASSLPPSGRQGGLMLAVLTIISAVGALVIASNTHSWHSRAGAARAQLAELEGQQEMDAALQGRITLVSQEITRAEDEIERLRVIGGVRAEQAARFIPWESVLDGLSATLPQGATVLDLSSNPSEREITLVGTAHSEEEVIQFVERLQSTLWCDLVPEIRIGREESENRIGDIAFELDLVAVRLGRGLR